MKRYYFPVFIVLLGLLAVYALYILWHVPSTTSPASSIEKPSEKPPKDLAVKEMIPKPSVGNDHNRAISFPSATVLQEDERPEERREENITLDTPALTPEQLKAKTQAVYDALTPEDYEETMEAAAAAFETLDAQVEVIEEQLAEEMEEAETNHIEDMAESGGSENEANEEYDKEADIGELDTEESPALTEDDEGVDATQEDVNNL